MDSQKTDVIPLEFRYDERDSYERPEELGIEAWVERKVFLSKRSEESGQVRLDRTPYMRPWLNAAVDDTIEEIFICASAQVAKTTFGVAVAGYFSDVYQDPVLMCLSDETTAKQINRDRLQKLFEESPELVHLIDDAPVVNKEEIELNNGGYIGIAWASSVSSLATREFRITIADEIDKPGYYVKTSESTALQLIRERTESYHNFKHIFYTTPTIEAGNITVELKSCDAIFDWQVPCPHCGVFQPLRFSPEHAYGFKDGKYRDPDGITRKLGRVTWEGRSKATPAQVKAAKYQCGTCGGFWSTAMKNRVVGKGVSAPRTELPEKEFMKKVGFHVNRLYSLLGKSGHFDRIVDRFLKAKADRDPKVLQGFMNSTLAEPHLPSKAIRKIETILALKDSRPRGSVPGGGVVAGLLAGVDSQDDCFPFEIRAFGYGLDGSSWCIREGVAPNLTVLRKILWEDTYKDPAGNQFFVRLTCHDAMGHRTKEVYDFCRQNRGAILPTQGKQTMASPFAYSSIEHYPGSKVVIPGGLTLVRFDTNYFKNALSRNLAIVGGDPGAWNYHSEISEEWAEQMTVEYIDDKGLWTCPEGKANHAWDCSVLCLLAYEILGVQFWPDPKESPPAQNSTKKKKPTPERRKRW